MDWWQAALIGIVEGLTEYLPVSSTAHILLTQRALGIYARRVGQMIRGVFGKDPEGLQLAINIVVAFLPAAVLGLLFNKTIKVHLFALWPICAAWFIGGVVILAFAYGIRRCGTKSVIDLSVRAALLIGLLQCLGMIPGTSRSLVTILGGLIVGLSMEAALEFSFLLGLVTLTAATVHDGYKHGSAMLHAYDPLTMAIGFIAAAIAAAVAVQWMLHYLRRGGLAVFGYYRIALAIVVAALLYTGRL